jgi:iron(III) transport system permease protein
MPIAPIILQSLIDRPLYDAGKVFTLKNYVDLLTSSILLETVRNTLLFASLTTVFAGVLGAVFAILIGRTDLPGRRILGSVLMWPMFMSQVVLSVGVFLAYGDGGYVTMYVKGLLGAAPWTVFSIPSMALIAGVTQMPLAMLYCLGSLALADASLEDAARSCGASPLRILTRITLPLLRPAILYGAVLNFTICIESLSIPVMFGDPAGIPFFTTLLYTKGITAPNPNYGLVGTAAVILLVVILGLVFVQSRLLRDTRRYVTVGGKATRPKLFALGALRWPALLVTLLYLLVFVIVPVGTLALRSVVKFLTPFVPFWKLLTLDNFVSIFSLPTSQRAMLNTLLLATVGAFIATAFCALIAVVANRSEFRFRKGMEYVALFPRALPGIVAGVGFFYAIIFFPPLAVLKNTVWLLMIVYAMRYIPTGYTAIAPTLYQIAPDLDRAARVVGADWWTTIRAIMLQLMRPALVTGYVLLFVSFVKEYSIAVFLFGPGSEVIGSQLLIWWMNGQGGGVAALSMVQIALTVVVVYVAQRVSGVKLYG